MNINKKGQALVEFAIILPVLILLIFGAFDFGRIILRKNELENTMSEVVSMFKDNKSNSEIEYLIKENVDNYEINYDKGEEYTKIILSSKVDILTPGVSNIIGSPYKVDVTRVIYNE